MKVSKQWLQTFFDAPLPSAEELSNALTFHAFEVEGVEGDVFDVKVTPNRGHDALSHRGIARELSAILNTPMRVDPLRQPVSLEPKTDSVTVTIEDPDLCCRYIAAHIQNVNVGPSPDWLRTSLESVGQKSINNVVDATNFVMFSLGQPLHAFDAGQLKEKYGKYSICVRSAKSGEKMLALDDKEYALTESLLVIVDGNSDVAIGIAGVKGGKPAGISDATKDIVIESANFNGVSVRKAAQVLKLRTDASERFQQGLSPELSAYGMRAAVDLILELAGGELAGFADEYPSPQKQQSVAISTARVNALLGTTLSDDDIGGSFTRLDLSFEKSGDEVVVTPPLERLDLNIPADLVEEVARIVGYEKIPATELPPFPNKPDVNSNFAAAERARKDLLEKGYSEVYTSVFADKGERAVLNKVGGERPYLRSTLVDGLRDSQERNARNKELLGLKDIRLFEIGTIWKDGTEQVMLGIADQDVKEVALKGQDASVYEDLPISSAERYEPFSKYPFIMRDIAMWVPQGPDAISEVLVIFAQEGGPLLRHVELFDQFKKDDRMSYAFHLVLQSFEKTLTDTEANEVMKRITAAVEKQGWQVR